VYIIIDWTFFINYDNKLYLMLLVCALNALDTSYLVSWISEDNFKFIIKQCNEIYLDKELKEYLTIFL